MCLGAGGIRLDRAAAEQLLQAVSGHAIEAEIQAEERARVSDDDVRVALNRELESAGYEASLAARRYELVDPAKRLVARELEGRWNIALERVAQLEDRLKDLEVRAQQRPSIDRNALLVLAHDLPTACNAGDTRTQQHLTRILVQEIVIEHDVESNQVVALIHWTGGRHSEVRVDKVRAGGFPEPPSAVEVIRKVGGHWPDRDLAVTLNRMRSKAPDGKTWTTTRVRDLRERLGIAVFDHAALKEETISVDETDMRLKICVGSVKGLIQDGLLPATQLMPSAP